MNGDGDGDGVEMKVAGDVVSLDESGATIGDREEVRLQAMNNELFVAKALFDYMGGQRQYELTFRKGTVLVVTLEGKGGWLWGHYEANPALDGWFPETWVEK